MQKLIPYWGLSPPPGSTYYLQKLSHDVFGIISHSDETTMLYIFDETVGPKITDHTLLYIQLTLDVDTGVAVSFLYEKIFNSCSQELSLSLHCC